MEEMFEFEVVDRRDQLRAPQLRALFDLWQACAPPGGGLTRAMDIDPEKAGVADSFWWLDMLPAPPGQRPDFIGRRAGPTTIANYGFDPVGRPVSDFARIPAYGRILRMLRTVIDSGRPQRFTADLSVMSHGRLFDVEALGLPVAGADGRLSGVAGATLARFS